MNNRNGMDTKEKSDLGQQTVSVPHEGDYQLAGWAPKFLQCFNNSKGCLTVMFIAVLAMSMFSGGFLNMNIAPLERRFTLDSTQSGLVVAGNDIGCMIVTLFVTYYGMNANRPRQVAIGVAVFGLGSLLYSIPHFTTGKYKFRAGQLEVTCSPSADNQTTCFQSENLSSYMGVLLLGSILAGWGSTALFTLGLAYLEDSVEKNWGGIYLGIINAGAVLGPVIGFIAGGKFLLDHFVDFDKGIKAPFPVTDPRWVGAWWVGPLFAMAISLVVAVPLAGFPQQLPGTNKIRADRISEAHDDGGSELARKSEFGKSIREFPKAFWIIVRNPIFVCITLSTCLQRVVLNGFSAFISKYLETKFHLPTGTSAILSGAILVPAGALGHILSGMLITRLKWKTPTILKFNIAMLVLVVGLSPIGFIHCDNNNVAGVTVPYRIWSNTSSRAMMHVNETLRTVNLTSECNANCTCQEEFFTPVCGADGITYFSPCHAGCMDANFSNNSSFPFEYTSCQCVHYPEQKAHPGACTTSCTSLPVFLAIMFFSTMFTFAPLTPSLVMTFRVVPEKMRSFAVGVQTLFVRGLGNIPGPLMYGALIDVTCVLWQTRQCDGSRGLCWIFNNENFNIVIVGLSMVFNFLALLLYVIAACLYKPECEASNQPCREQAEVAATENTVYEETGGQLQKKI